jgi:Do/DeqQ family serine protease
MARAHVWVRQASLGLLAAALVTYPVAEPPHAALPAGQQYSAAPVLRAVTPGVVNIATRSLETFANPLLRDPAFREFYGVPDRALRRETRSAGSGVIVDARSGYVLTNDHVIKGADLVEVTTKDNRRFPAELVGRDPDTDIAVLRIKADRLTAVPFGDSDRVEVGDFVLAIGNPFGIGQTATSGIVSAVGRTGLGIEGYEDFIQTDASINPGNSGGALVNLQGELIGINTAILSRTGGNVGIGFAVPINMARSVMEQIITHGKVERGRIGIIAQDLTPDLAEVLGMSGEGAVVSAVEPGSPAARSDLRQGDIVTALGGVPIKSSAQLRNAIGLKRAGTEVDVTYKRKGSGPAKTVTVMIEPAHGNTVRSRGFTP